MRIKPGKIKSIFTRGCYFLKTHGYHLLFGLTLVFLTALVTWWAIFFRAAIEQERERKYETLTSAARYFSITIGHQKDPPVEEGVFQLDPRLEIVRCSDASDPLSFQLQPFWPHLCIKPKAGELMAIEKKFAKRKMMVIGESSFLLILVLLSIFMLYRLIIVERKFTRELNEFWSRVTHEIKTPITGIKAFLQTLKSEKLKRDEIGPLVDMALEQVERQERLAENILIGHRLSKGGMGLKLTEVNLSDYIDHFVEGHRLYLGERKVEVNKKFDDGIMVNADPDALHVILDNLLNNAVKYCGKDLILRIDLLSDKSTATVIFSDNGPGFDPKETETLFLPYRRLSVESASSHQGTGMGLFISHQLAHKMGGNLAAFSEGRGRGARFNLTLKGIPQPVFFTSYRRETAKMPADTRRAR